MCIVRHHPSFRIHANARIAPIIRGVSVVSPGLADSDVAAGLKVLSESDAAATAAALTADDGTWARPSSGVPLTETSPG